MTEYMETVLSTRCGNWASYSRNGDLAFCGWMNFHTDLGSGASKTKPMFLISIEYVDDDARLVHRVAGLLVSEKPEIGKLMTFDATKLHALLPSKVADDCVSTQSVRHQKRVFKCKDDLVSMYDEKVRMVWKWR
jgi:hypothetical protein